MTKDVKRRLKSMLLALTLIGTMSSTKLPKVKAENNLNDTKKIVDNLNYEQGTFIDGETYKMYVVKEKDNLSVISRKICRYYNAEVTTKYWPVLAFLNDFPRIIQPGEIIVFLNSIDDMEKLLAKLNNQGWTNKYKTNNHVYGNERKNTVRDLIKEIYGDAASNNPEFVANFLNAHNLDNEYDIDSEIKDYNQLFELTEWIPTLEELGYQKTK